MSRNDILLQPQFFAGNKAAPVADDWILINEFDLFLHLGN